MPQAFLKIGHSALIVGGPPGRPVGVWKKFRSEEQRDGGVPRRPGGLAPSEKSAQGEKKRSYCNPRKLNGVALYLPCSLLLEPALRLRQRLLSRSEIRLQLQRFREFPSRRGRRVHLRVRYSQVEVRQINAGVHRRHLDRLLEGFRRFRSEEHTSE